MNFYFDHRGNVLLHTGFGNHWYAPRLFFSCLCLVASRQILIKKIAEVRFLKKEFLRLQRLHSALSHLAQWLGVFFTHTAYLQNITACPLACQSPSVIFPQNFADHATCNTANCDKV